MSRIAVIILNWNGGKLLREFLPSVIKYTNKELGRVVVVDNFSTDDSLEVMALEFPDVELIRFDRNYGFAGGYNRAIDQIGAEYVLLLNSDVEVTADWLEPLVALLDDDPKVAAVQPKIRAYRNKTQFEYAGACGGYIDELGFPFCRGRVLDVTEEDTGQYDEVAEIFWCSGAALCIRREAYLEAGGLDERFFAHMEEIDLCWRLRNKGYSLKVNPLSVVYHLGGGSLPMNHPKKLFLNYRNNLLMLYKNLDRKSRQRVLSLRMLLDGAAFILFILKGERANARSVWHAYRDYRQMKRSYKGGTGSSRVPCIYQGSIVFDYFLRGKKSFTRLNMK